MERGIFFFNKNKLLFICLIDEMIVAPNNKRKLSTEKSHCVYWCLDMRPDALQKPENRGREVPKRYIGETNDFRGRKDKHYSVMRKGGQTPFCKYLRAVPEEYHHWEVIADGLTEQQANDLETALIAKFDTNVSRGGKGGYNATDGGEGTSGHKHTKEYCEARSGENNPNWQKEYTKEERAQISKTLTGRKHTTERVENNTKAKRKRLLDNLKNNPMQCIRKRGTRYWVNIQHKHHGSFTSYEEARAYAWKWYLAFYL